MTALLVVGLILGVIVVITLVSAITDTVVDLAGKGLGRALRGPKPQGFVALEFSSSRVLRGLADQGILDLDTGHMSIGDGWSVYLQAGWLGDIRGLECRWDPARFEQPADIMTEVAAAILTVDEHATVIRV